MEYKICENCGAKIHVRTAKCPICNIILTDASQIITDDIPTPNFDKPENLGENIDIQINDTEITNNVAPNNTENVQNSNNVEPKETKDYIYKAEVRHSIEYTKPLSNALKVFLTAISMTPIIGQFLGTFLGIFFASYDDTDRRSFGRALILLSIIMFMMYTYSLLSSELLTSGDISNYLNNFSK